MSKFYLGICNDPDEIAPYDDYPDVLLTWAQVRRIIGAKVADRLVRRIEREQARKERKARTSFEEYMRKEESDLGRKLETYNWGE